MQRLIRKIAERITADYTRLSIVSNPDGLLTNPVVQSHLLSECGLNVVVGSQLQLRIHYELIYKASQTDRFVYVCPSTDSVLPDMAQDARVTDFSIGQLFPLFADKNLLQQLSFEELVMLSHKMGTRRINMTEGRRMVEDIRKEENEKLNQHYARKLSSVDVWIDDRNLGGLPDWGTIYQIINERKTYYQVMKERLRSSLEAHEPPKKKHWWSR